VTSTLWRAPEGPVKLRYSTIGDFEFRAGRLLERSKGSRTYQGDAPAGGHRTLVRQAREAMYTELTPALPLVMSNPGMKILSTRTGSPGTTAENLAHGLLSRNHATAPELHSEVHTGLGLARSLTASGSYRLSRSRNGRGVTIRMPSCSPSVSRSGSPVTTNAVRPSMAAATYLRPDHCTAEGSRHRWLRVGTTMSSNQSSGSMLERASLLNLGVGE